MPWLPLTPDTILSPDSILGPEGWWSAETDGDGIELLDADGELAAIDSTGEIDTLEV